MRIYVNATTTMNDDVVNEFRIRIARYDYVWLAVRNNDLCVYAYKYGFLSLFIYKNTSWIYFLHTQTYKLYALLVNMYTLSV